MGSEHMASRALHWLGALAAGGLLWGHFEAGWVRRKTLACPVRELPAELEGLRIVHLSDFHLGAPSRGERAAANGVGWARGRKPDLTCLTGDLVAHPRGVEPLRRLVADLGPTYAVLGNHDFGLARDPFVRAAAPFSVDGITMLLDDTASFEVRGRRVQVVGVDPRSYMARGARPERLADPTADLRILLCHFPRVVDRLPAGTFQLVLSGHLHDGQISLPYGRGKLRLAHLRFPYPCGIYRRPAATLHVSPGLGTTFVPFRLFARPEVTELVLESG